MAPAPSVPSQSSTPSIAAAAAASKPDDSSDSLDNWTPDAGRHQVMTADVNLYLSSSSDLECAMHLRPVNFYIQPNKGKTDITFSKTKVCFKSSAR